MNRQIKFRGMDANGIMRYGRLSQDMPNSTRYYKEFSQRICWDYSNIPVSNKTLGQFTGLLDKNGKEVYEGDILKIPENNIIAVVAYEEQQAGFFAQIKSFDEILSARIDNLRQRNIEIIGNICENPELLIENKI